jgi:hypothetical protein
MAPPARTPSPLIFVLSFFSLTRARAPRGTKKINLALWLTELGSYLNSSGLGSGMKPSRLGIRTFGSVSASMTVVLSIILPSARM